MKVLVIHCTYKFKGGEDTVVAEEVKLLRSRGITVELLQFYNHGNSAWKILQLPFNFRSYRETRKKLNSFKADVVHIHNLHYAGSPSVIYAVKKSNVPVVITLHSFRLLCPSATLYKKGGLYLNSLRQAFPWNAIGHGVYRDSRLLTFWVSFSMQMHLWMGTWKMLNRYIVLSQHAKKIFLESKMKLRNDQMIVKPNFCAPPALTPKHTDDYFLYVGRLSEEKGIMLMLKAFASSNYKLKIAGDGPLRKQVMSYCSQFSNIEFLDFQNKDSIFCLLSDCSALVFPSIWFEGMPLTIIEAFACAAPVITSRLGAMENMIRDDYNGLHFEPGSVQDFKAKLDKWKNYSDDERAAFRENARKTYEQHYTLEKNFEQLLSIYNSVIEGKNVVINKTLRTA